MEFILHIYIFGTIFSKEFYDINQNLVFLSNFWRDHKDIVSHLTICRYGEYQATLTNYEDFEIFVSKRGEV